MRFSIIVPVYNVESYLDDCANSVLNQSFADWEMILIDDGSTDSSAEKCDVFSREDTRIRCIHKENGGLSDARNAGITAALGEYIVFLDGDDMLDDYALSNINELLCSEPDMLIGRYIEFEKTGLHIKHDIFNPDVKKMNCGNVDTVITHIMNKNGFSCMAWKNVYRRLFLSENALYFKKGIYHEDEHWTPLVFVANPSVCYLASPFYLYRVNRKNSIMRNHNLTRDMDKISIACELHALSANESLSSEKRIFLNYRVAMIYSSILMYSYELTPVERKKILLEAAKYIWLIDGCDNKKVKFERLLIKMVGVRATAFLLGIRERIK